VDSKCRFGGSFTKSKKVFFCAELATLVHYQAAAAYFCIFVRRVQKRDLLRQTFEKGSLIQKLFEKHLLTISFNESGKETKD